jgi:tetratricopeptide (TPR) repeat protein
MTYVAPTPDELIDQLNLRDAPDIDQALMSICNAEFDAEDRPQDLQLAFNCVRAILMRHWDNPDPSVQKHVAEALLRRGQLLVSEKYIDAARRDFEEIWARYKDSTETEVRRAVAGGLLEVGTLEEELGNKIAAQKWYELTSHYENDTDNSTLVRVVRAQGNACDILIDRDWMDPAIEKIHWLRDRWGNHPEYWIRRRIANLLVAKGNGLIENEERSAEAPQALEEALSYAEEALTPPVYFIQADARLGKCRALQRLESYLSTIQFAEETEKWAELLEASISKEEYDYVRRRIDLIYLTKAGCLHALGRDEEALIAFDSSGVGLDQISDDPDNTISTLKKLTTQVDILCELRRWDEAEAFHSNIMKRIISLGMPKKIEVFAYAAMIGANISMARRSAGLPDPE